MAARQPAGLLSRALEHREISMHLPIGRGDKGFHQRSYRQLTLSVLPSLRDDLAILIKKKVRQIRIAEIPCQHCRSRLRVQILYRRASGRDAMAYTQHNDYSRYKVPFVYGIQRYVTVCWILSFVWRVMISSESNFANARLKLAMFCEKNCGSASLVIDRWSTRLENL